MGPGGKGSNQAVAAARAGADVIFFSRIGRDAFGDLAIKTWDAEGIRPRVARTAEAPTGAAFIYVDETRGDNAIIVVSGAADGLSPADVDAAADAIRTSRVFVTQLEQPVAAAQRGLEIARAAGSITVFNPAPAAAFDDSLFALCDYITPNETEAEALTGIAVSDLDDARRAGDALLAKGAGTALITLGERGALFHGRDRSLHVPAVRRRQGGRNRGRGRCIRRRLRGSACGRRRSPGSGALRFRHGGDFRDARGDCACHAAAR